VDRQTLGGAATAGYSDWCRGYVCSNLAKPSHHGMEGGPKQNIST
jgi:hypothetical protein